MLSADIDNLKDQVRRPIEERDTASGDAVHWIRYEWNARLAEHRCDADHWYRAERRAFEDHNLRLLNNARIDHEAVVANRQDRASGGTFGPKSASQGRTRGLQLYNTQICDLKAEIYSLRAKLSSGWPTATLSQEDEQN